MEENDQKLLSALSKIESLKTENSQLGAKIQELKDELGDAERKIESMGADAETASYALDKVSEALRKVKEKIMGLERAC